LLACNLGAKIASKTLDLTHAGPIIRVSFFQAIVRAIIGTAHSAETEEVIMTGKMNYVPCVDLKNLHIPLT
jgi:hypothetical protein